MARELTGQGDTEDYPPIYDLDKFLIEAKVLFKGKWSSKDVPRAQMRDFERFRTVGKGASGRVMLVRHKSTGTYCAMKVLEKAALVRTKQVDRTYRELKTLVSVQFPFLVSMLFAMKDNSHLYFVLPFIVGGDMYAHLKDLGNFTEEHARFYAIQVCLALQYLHYIDIAYRDLKPENIMIDSRGYLKLVDFGFCKIVQGRTYTFCGTSEYLAPEIILQKGHGKAVDWWSYGVLLYEMNAGYTPFSARDPMQVYAKIISGRLKYSHHFSVELQDLISNLLQIDTTKRYGNLRNGVEDIKRHKWFKNVNWLNILNYRVEAPYKPRYSNEADTLNFYPIKEKPLKFGEKDKYGKLFENF